MCAAARKKKNEKVETVIEAEQQPLEQREPSLPAIERDLKAGEPIPVGDAQFLLEKLNASVLAEQKAASEIEAGKKRYGELHAKAVENAKQLAAAREILTLWLALRGSSTLEIFQASQGLADRTVGLLNQ